MTNQQARMITCAILLVPAALLAVGPLSIFGMLIGIPAFFGVLDGLYRTLR